MSVRTMRGFGALLTLSAAFGQTPVAGPRFEAGTIRPHTVNVTRPIVGGWRRVDKGRVELLAMTLPQLISTAYRLEPYQNVTGPDWMKKTYFDVFATLPDGANKAQIPEMLQALLADELKLVLRREEGMEPVCVLSIGKNGPKLKPVAVDAKPDPSPPRSDRQIALLRRKTSEGYLTYSRLNGTVVLDATKITLAELAVLLRRELNVPVLNRTGLQGFYQVSLFVPGAWIGSGRLKPDGEGAMAQAGSAFPDFPAASEPEGVNLFKSIQRLGLKLEKSKAPIEHLVVESADQNPAYR
jgi:uncharacterized protein (TIGR03435 family)